MTPVHRQLVLIRHAKAEDPYGQADHDRRLTTQGLADAQELGLWLRAKGVRPDEVLCSTAARTRETWAAVVDVSGLGALTEHDPVIYNAAVDTLLDRIRLVPNGVRTLVLVGHAPGIPGLAGVLTQSPEGSVDLQLHEYPTCTASLIATELSWDQIGPGTCNLIEVHTARAATD